MISIFLVLAVVVTVGLWAIQLRTRNAATADLGWTILVAAGTALAAIASDAPIERRLLVSALAIGWALRLGWYLLRDRAWPGRPEDGRYRALRARWGASAPKYFLGVYLVQGAIAALFVIPIRAAMVGGALDAWALAGAVVAVGAIGLETMADRQLACFRADPASRGKVCDAGLWRYSRHPNYFAEWLHWWGYVLIGAGAWPTWVGPAAMLIFLFRITGIPYTELQAVASRGDAYREYQRCTSVFIPLPRSSSR